MNKKYIIKILASSIIINLIMNINYLNTNAQDIESPLTITTQNKTNIIATDYKFIIDGKEYKLKGDGSNEFRTLQLMFDNIHEQYKGSKVSIHFPEGTYCTSRRITIYDNMTITGVEGKTIFKNTSKKHFFVNGITTDHINYEKLKREYNQNAGSNITIKNITFDESRVIGISHGKNIIIDNIHVINCPNGHAMEISASKSIHIRNSIFEGMNPTNGSEAINSRDYNEVIQLDNNHEKGFTHFGRYNDENYRVANETIVFDNCVFKPSKEYAYQVAIGTHGNISNEKVSFKNIVIKNCKFDGATKATIRFPLVDSISLHNNTISNTPIGFQYFNSGENYNTWRLTLKNNTFSNVSVGALIDNDTTKSIIQRVDISDNIFKGADPKSSVAIKLLGVDCINSISYSNNTYSNVKEYIYRKNEVVLESSINGNKTLKNTYIKAKINSDGKAINIRSGAGNNYSIIGELNDTANVQIDKLSNGWSRIIYGNQDAYVESKYLKIRDTEKSCKTVMINGKNVPLRKGAFTTEAKIATMNNNEEVDIILTCSNGWYKIKYKDLIGCVPPEYIKIK